MENSHEQRDRNIYVKGVPKSIKRDLVNIAENKGISLSALLKPHLVDIRDSYPEKYRTPRQED